MKAGKAKIKLDPVFASLVLMKTCCVFLTPKGDSNGLYVSRQNRDGFEVREQKGGKANLAFDYRVVARRKDVPAGRLKSIVKPKTPLVPKPARSTIPEAPKAAECAQG